MKIMKIKSNVTYFFDKKILNNWIDLWLASEKNMLTKSNLGLL